jgi:hypothetical protein
MKNLHIKGKMKMKNFEEIAFAVLVGCLLSMNAIGDEAGATLLREIFSDYVLLRISLKILELLRYLFTKIK